jgi:hypothetical protein
MNSRQNNLSIVVIDFDEEMLDYVTFFPHSILMKTTTTMMMNAFNGTSKKIEVCGF